LFAETIQRAQARREGAKKVIEGLVVATQSNDDAQTDELLKKLREGLRQFGEGRETFLNAFDQLLQPKQRAAILLQIVQRAKEAGKPVEQFVDDFIVAGGDSN
jgi:Spy/CpxP family protein refolding chaperone